MSGSSLLDSILMALGIFGGGFLFGVSVGFGLSAADRLIPRRIAPISLNLRLPEDWP